MVPIMFRPVLRIFSLGGLLALGCLCGVQARAADSGPATESKADATAKPAKSASKKLAPQKKVLTPEQTALRDRTRETLAMLRQQPFSTSDNTPSDLIHLGWAFGCQTEVHQGDASGPRINGITALCWDFPCDGFRLLTTAEDHIAARIGFGLQETPSQFLAMLALGAVPADYPVRCGNITRTVADLVEYEKLDCQAGTDLSLKLIAFSHYVDQPTWKNRLGESWSVRKMVDEELSRKDGASEQAVTKLLALSLALAARQKDSQPLEDEFVRAKKFVEECQNYALATQNYDGIWDLPLIAGSSATRNSTSQFLATGQMVEWLALSLPKDRLEDARLAKSVEYLIGMLNSPNYRGRFPAANSQDLAAMAHAAHALVVYDARVFKPADVEEPAAGKDKDKVASR